jgi:dethiobiotin synthetase
LPINSEQVLPDVVQQCAMPIIMVVGMRLGCLNHALLTQQAIQASGCHIAGWIANAPETQPFFNENLATLQARIDAPLLGVIPKVASATEAASYLDISLLV